MSTNDKNSDTTVVWFTSASVPEASTSNWGRTTSSNWLAAILGKRRDDDDDDPPPCPAVIAPMPRLPSFGVGAELEAA